MIKQYERTRIFEGKRKNLYQTCDEYLLIQFFKDEFQTSEDKSIEIQGKGALNNNISAFIMEKLDMIGIENHFIEKLNMREQLIQMVDIFPFEVNLTKIACDKYVSQFGIQEGYVFDNPIIEYIAKGERKPRVNEQQMINFNWLTSQELQMINNYSLRINDFLTGLFAAVQVRMVSCCLEFGRVFNGEDFIIMLADEITPDKCRLWDLNTNQKLDFDYVNSNENNLIMPYQEIAKRFKLK